MRKTITSLHSYCYRIIDSRLERKKAGGAMGGTKAGKDLLELFIDQGISREELLPVLLNFIVAGRDTTAQSLAWFFFEMWKYPEHIAKIRETLVPVLGAPGEQRPMDFEDYKELPYLHACFYEAIRVRQAQRRATSCVLLTGIADLFSPTTFSSALARRAKERQASAQGRHHPAFSLEGRFWRLVEPPFHPSKKGRVGPLVRLGHGAHA
jgi:hypothetical protein